MFSNISGICELCNSELEDLTHILVPKCPLPAEKACSLVKFARESLSKSKTVYGVCRAIFESKLLDEDNIFVRFVFDPSVVPEIITAERKIPGTLQILMGITNSSNRTRIKLIGSYNFPV